MKIIITRPAPDGEKLGHLLSACGVAYCLSPVMRIEPTGVAVRHEGVGALAFTSANSIRLYCNDQGKDFSLPVFAVGQETANACRDAGFTTVFDAGGDVERLAARIIAAKSAGSFYGKIAHIAGKDRAGDLPALLTEHQIEVIRFVLYRAGAIDRLSEEARLSLINAAETGGAEPGGAELGVVFFSARTVCLFIRQLAHENFDVAGLNLTAFCLSENVAQAAKAVGLVRTICANERSTSSMAQLISTMVTKR